MLITSNYMGIGISCGFIININSIEVYKMYDARTIELHVAGYSDIIKPFISSEIHHGHSLRIRDGKWIVIRIDDQVPIWLVGHKLKDLDMRKDENKFKLESESHRRCEVLYKYFWTIFAQIIRSPKYLIPLSTLFGCNWCRQPQPVANQSKTFNCYVDDHGNRVWRSWAERNLKTWLGGLWIKIRPESTLHVRLSKCCCYVQASPAETANCLFLKLYWIKTKKRMN